VKIVLIAGSPAHSTRGASLLAHVESVAVARGISVSRIEVRSIPAAELMTGSRDSTALIAAAADIESSHGVVVATPVYKAAYTGLLKCFLDTLPVDTTLRGKVIFPIVTAAAPTHGLAIDYALKPVLASLGASVTCSGMFAIDTQFEPRDDGTVVLKADVLARYDAAIAEFLDTCAATARKSSPDH
jgi:FMN reductase